MTICLLLALSIPAAGKEGDATIPQWATEQLRLLEIVRQWVGAAYERQSQIPFGKAATDEANFMFTWFGYYRLTGDERVLQTAEALFDGFEKWMREQGLHGYYPRQEAHHGPEPFLFFPTRLWQLGRRTQAIQAMYRQVADHCANWSEGVPDWYDWDKHVFRSYYLGTQVVEAEKSPQNRPDHLRFAQIALSAYRLTGERRYLEWAEDYVGHWAREMVNSERIYPVLLPTALAQGTQEKRSDHMLVEWHVGGGSLDVLLDLYRLAPKDEYVKAFVRAIPLLTEAASKQWGHPAAGLLMKYRQFTGDRSFDAHIQDALSAVKENITHEIRGVKLPQPQPHPLGIGMRHDMVIWEYKQPSGEWASDSGLSPPALVLLYRLTGNRAHLDLAMRKAAQRMEWAIANLKDGREHSDAGWCIAAVAGGHGRDYGWGELSGALFPMTLGSLNFCGEDLVEFDYSHNGRPGLPNGVAALVEPGDPTRVVLVNTTGAPLNLSLWPLAGAAIDITLPARSEKTVAVVAPPEPQRPGADQPVGFVKSEFIYEQAPFPSCHASTIAEAKDALVCAWFGGTREGHPDVGIWLSRDEGEGWSVPAEVANGVQEDGTRYPCWNPVLFQPKNGPLLLFYKVGPNPREWWGMMMKSEDDGKTWSKPTRLPDGILGPIKNKPVQLPDGTILCGSSTEHDGWRVHMERTPDQGATWQKTEPLNDGKEFGAIQPTILRYGPGSMQILCRSRQSRIVECWSADDGKTWGPMQATSLPNPNSGIDAVMLRDGRALLVYNHTAGGRTPLNVAISKDGKAWSAALVLESDPGEYSYPAVIQTADDMVHITYTWKRQRIRHVVLDPELLAPRDMVDAHWPT